MFDENTKDMGEEKEFIVLTCGSEKIIIETNDMYSDVSDFTDTSSCSSESDYEEIEVDLPSNATKYCSESKFLNPYVRLVRCDHLVTKMSTSDTNVEDRFQSRTPGSLRSSRRKRRPNYIYNSDEFTLFDYTFKNVPRSSSRSKKKVAKATANKVCFNRKCETRLAKSNEEFSVDYDSSSTSRFNFNVTTDGILNPSPALTEHRKLESLNDERFQNNTYGYANSMCISYSNQWPIETSSKPWTSAIVKSEPVDFEEITNSRCKQSSSTVINDYSFYHVKSEENNIDSSDSEIDVVNDWDGPVFIFHPEIVGHDHPYSISYNSGQTSIQGKEQHSASAEGLIARKTNKSPQTLASCRASTHKPSPRIIGNKEKVKVAKTDEKKEMRLMIHNKLERVRRQFLAESLKELRDKIPQLQSKIRVSKLRILILAARYIRNLKETEEVLEKEARFLREKNAKLTKIHDKLAALIDVNVL